MKNLFLFLTLVGWFYGCVESDPIIDNIISGVKPIYSADDDWKTFKVLDAQPIKNLGKIYYKDQTIYVNERLKGIHIIDNADPANPIPLKFIEIVGNKDIAIKGNILYADNLTDLISLDISDLNDIKSLGRVKNIYPENQLSYPPDYQGFFECVDNTKGVVIGWESAMLNNPDCQR